MLTLYANGCSMTFGHDLGPCNDPICNTRAWPAHLGKRMDATVINDAVLGGSNDRIVRRTTHYVANYLASGRSANDLRVVIGWTLPIRREFHDTNSGRWYNFIPNDDKSAGSLTSHYCPDFCSTEEASGRYYAQMLTMQGFLKNLGILYAFFTALEYPDEAKPAPLVGLINDRFFLRNTSFHKWSHDLKYEFGPDGHPLEPAHHDWAVCLYSLMWL